MFPEKSGFPLDFLNLDNKEGNSRTVLLEFKRKTTGQARYKFQPLPRGARCRKRENAILLELI